MSAKPVVEPIAIHTFITGLKDQSAAFLVKARNPKTLNAAISDALEVQLQAVPETALWAQVYPGASTCCQGHPSPQYQGQRGHRHPWHNPRGVSHAQPRNPPAQLPANSMKYQAPNHEGLRYHQPNHHSYRNYSNNRSYQGYNNPGLRQSRENQRRFEESRDRLTPHRQLVLIQQEAERNQLAECDAEIKLKCNKEQHRMEANFHKQAVDEARRSNDEESKHREEEARQKFEKEEAEGQLFEMIEPLYHVDNEDSAESQLRRKSEREKAVAAARERSAIPPTPKNKNRRKKNRTSTLDTYDKGEASHADSDNSDCVRRKLSTAAAKRRAAATHSDELVIVNHEAEPAVIPAFAKEEKAETIERINRRRHDRLEATGVLTTVYAIKESGNPNQVVEAGPDRRSEQPEKVDIDSFLLCLANFRPPQKQLQQQLLQTYNTDEKERSEYNHLDYDALRPSDGRWVPPAA
ncbi:splicing regulatory glutamine/lysine-rich protein 1-like [Anopheles bellator]|uniref:splicing regulatory glutamine/lysine-rich protein 1-like n=1 Tax=Anopheles bellator TaxID=139047 RepID=UPI0026498B38|nr:splicing regulatory glutamine/lysine-rich protein 1-like [Anopheles bellator]